MVKDEALMFFVYDKKEDGPRFVMHTAFDHPDTPENCEDRVSLECRAIACFDDSDAPKSQFFDMKHSNNAARVRLWLRLKGLTHRIDSTMITYADLQSPAYAHVNPLKKVPALMTDSGHPIFESFVIMQYLEDRFGDQGTPLVMDTPEDRAFV